MTLLEKMLIVSGLRLLAQESEGLNEITRNLNTDLQIEEVIHSSLTSLSDDGLEKLLVETHNRLIEEIKLSR